MRDLQRAFDESGGQDRPLVKAVDWGDLSPCRNRTGPAKSDSADGCSGGRKAQGSGPDRVTSGRPCWYRQNLHCAPIATQTRRSFYAIAPADVPTPEKLAQVFARAREQSPSILFFDEIDGLLPRGDNGYFMGQHQIQLVEQALMLMSQLDPGNQVFLVGQMTSSISIRAC